MRHKLIAVVAALGIATAVLFAQEAEVVQRGMRMVRGNLNLDSGSIVVTSGNLTVGGTSTLTGATALTTPTVAGNITIDESTADATVQWPDQTAAATLQYPDLNGTDAGAVVAATCKMAASDGHTAAVGTSTCTLELPAGSVLLDIQVQTTVLWNAGTSTTLQVGDDDAATGWFVATNLQATDMVVGEIFSAMHGDLWGGLNGAYLVAATGRRGRVTAGVDSGNYFGVASEVIATAVTVGTVPTVGTTYITVFYVQPVQEAAVFAAT